MEITYNIDRYRRRYVFMVKDNRHVVGIAVGVVKRWLCSKYFELYKLMVKPTACKKGVGTRLLEEIEKAFRNQKGNYIWVPSFTENAKGFYEKRGFTTKQGQLGLKRYIETTTN